MTLCKALAALVAAFTLSVALPVLAHDVPAGDPAAHAVDSVKLGDMEISGAFTRATLPNAPVAGGFLTITNSGATDDRLVSASAYFAAEVQLHEMAMENDVMKMRQLVDGIAVPAGETVTLQPGGLHIMFMQLKAPLVEGTTVPVTLTFERVGTITVDVPVVGTAADAPMHHVADAHSAAAHGETAHHGSGMAVDQGGMSDLDAITHMQKALFDTPDNPLAMGPIVIAGDYAVSDWSQGGVGGRALLRKTETGWAIHLCSGAALKEAAALVQIGVPDEVAAQLAEQIAAAEADLPADQVALYDSFDGTMMVDEDLI